MADVNPDLPALSLAAVPGRRDRTIELAQEIERRGYPGIYGPSLGDALGLSLSLAHATETIEFGTTVVNMYTRNPLDFAATASYIHEVSGGRFRFGVGVSHAPANDRLGVNPGKPLSDMREFIAAVEEAPRVGELPPITVAAMRDKMVALSTEIASGFVHANAALSECAGTIGRMPDVDDDFFIGNMIPTCIDDDKQAAAAVNRKTLTSYAALPNYRNYWKQAGYVEEMEAIEQAVADRNWDAIPGLLSDRWLNDVTLYGSATEVRDGVEAWRDAGMRTPILVPSSANGGQFQAFQEVFETFG